MLKNLSVPATGIRFYQAALFLCALLAFTAAGSQAQSQAAYKLGPSDVLAVIVDKHPQFSVEQVTVTPTGNITVPVANQVNVTGKTLSQLEAELTKRLKERLLRPRVTVTLVRARPQQIFVLGPVAKPGTYEMQPGWRISEALTMAGGLTVRPALTEATLSRPNGQTTPLDLGSILNNSNSAANLELQPGDRLLITERTIRVTVAGQVKQAGQFSIPIGSSASDALSFASGAEPDAALTQASIRRANGTVQPVNLFKVTVQNDKTSDVELREGDVLTIPKSEARITVLGSVARPGDIQIEDGRSLRVAQAVARAGNYTANAALTRATVQRADGEIIPVNLYDVLELGNTAGNILLEPGDVLSIPESKDVVTVLGAVNKPGILEIADGRTLSVAEALAMAGSYNNKAALTRASVRRQAGADVRILPVDLYQIIVRGQQQNDIRLEPGDVIVIPEAKGITVLGSVARPGSYYLEEGASPRLSTALASAGGLDTNLQPEDVRINITRTEANGNQTPLSVDAARLLTRDDQTQNARLEDGDLITISPVGKRTVFISGEVERPGSYELKEGEGVAELITRAGDAKATAALTQVSVVQNGTSQVVDVYPALKEGAPLDMPLSAGALVTVPENKNRVLVLQAVRAPGTYTIPERQAFTLGDALDAAGGTQPNAKIAYIARETPDGKVHEQKVAFNDNKNGLTTNIPLQSGDVIYIPDGTQDQPWWRTALGFLGPLSILFR